MGSSRWLGFRLDGTVLLLLAVSTFGAVACKEAPDVEVDVNLLAGSLR